jgi:hypothetical protein
MYREPSIVVLGGAAALIQGQKEPPITVDSPGLHDPVVVVPAYEPQE